MSFCTCNLNYQQAAADVVTMGTDAGLMQHVSSRDTVRLSKIISLLRYPELVLVGSFPYWTFIVDWSLITWHLQSRHMHHSVMSKQEPAVLQWMSLPWHHKRDQSLIKANWVYPSVTDWTWLIDSLIAQEKCGAKVLIGQHGRSVSHRWWDHWRRVRQILHGTSHQS